jgi:hypothetical protein
MTMPTRIPMSPRPLLAMALVLGALLSPLSLAAEPVVDRVGAPGPIRFGGTEFVLAWSSHPSADLFKQEYLPAGQDVERYESMVMLDVRPTGASATQMAAGMVQQLKARKATDPVVNYDLLLKPAGNEALLDFVISANDPASGVLIEWNAYRYTTGTDGRGTVMLGISRRAYGDAAARAFFTGLKASRARDIDTLARLPIADVKSPAP